MKWEIKLSGDTFDLKKLAESVLNDDLRVSERDDQYYLESRRFESVATHEEVSAEASKILGILTGAIRLWLGGRTPLSIATVAQVQQDGKLKYFVCLNATAHARATVSTKIQKNDGTIGAVNPDEEIPGWVNLAFHDNKVIAKVLRLLGAEKEHDWTSLNRLYEEIEGDVGSKEKIKSEGWASIKLIDRFKHTANSSTAGDASRHGGKKMAKPPKHPMTIGQARVFIMLILHNWLEWKMT